jgi:hypothetical protein
MSDARHWERGLTLTEITITLVLAAVLMTGLVVFYLNSQSVWIDGSAQAITQREATLVLHEIADRTRSATGVSYSPGPPTVLTLRLGESGPRQYVFRWDSDSLLYEDYTDASGVVHPLGPILQSRVATFAAGFSGSIVAETLSVLTPQRIAVSMSSSASMINLGAP